MTDNDKGGSVGALFQPGVYFIVSAYKAERYCVDIPSETYQNATGVLQKFNPNASRYQKWRFEVDPTSANHFRIVWPYANKWLVGKTGRTRWESSVPDATGSWAVTPAPLPATFFISCRGTQGHVIDYWSDDDRPHGEIGLQQVNAGATQHMWILEQTHA